MTTSSPCTILWDIPSSKSVTDASILSFLTPLQEHELLANGVVKNVVTMSRVMDAVSVEAREFYLDVVADIGLYTLPDGRTLRKALGGRGIASQWWYHPVAFRDSERDPTYANILAILAIVREVQARNAGELHLVRPPVGVAEVLRSRFRVVVEKPFRSLGGLTLMRRLLGRMRFLLRVFETKLALRQYHRSLQPKMDVALQGFWDWSVLSDSSSGGQLRDRYFGKLPEELRKRGKRVGYWCWYDPWNRPGKSRRHHEEVLAPLQTREDVLILQSLLTLREVIAAVLDFRSLLIILGIAWKRAFRNIFVRHGLNFYPLFRLPLVSGCMGSEMPQCRLIERAAARAQAETKPRLMVCFLEHFPPSRAIYAGLRGSDTRSWAIQHASYNQGKTFAALHAYREFSPQEDGKTVPHPDRVCVMGELGARLFRGCGYEQDQVLLTGSARFDHIHPPEDGARSPATAVRDRECINVLITTSLPAKADFLLAEASVEAGKGLEDRISLRLRQHPFDRMESQPGYARIAPRLEMSHNTLEEDLAWSDLILFSQSTVGEEAFLAGKAVWQFRYPHPDQSALVEVAAIPRFYTVSELRNALGDFASTGGPVGPSEQTLEEVYHALFQTTNERPSMAIAEAICAEFQ